MVCSRSGSRWYRVAVRDAFPPPCCSTYFLLVALDDSARTRTYSQTLSISKIRRRRLALKCHQVVRGVVCGGCCMLMTRATCHGHPASRSGWWWSSLKLCGNAESLQRYGTRLPPDNLYRVLGDALSESPRTCRARLTGGSVRGG